MAELNPREQLALHEFSVQYRKAYVEKNPLSDLHLETFQDAIRGEYDREKTAKPDVSVEQQSPEPQKEREPEEPEI